MAQNKKLQHTLKAPKLADTDYQLIRKDALAKELIKSYNITKKQAPGLAKYLLEMTGAKYHATTIYRDHIDVLRNVVHLIDTFFYKTLSDAEVNRWTRQAQIYAQTPELKNLIDPIDQNTETKIKPTKKDFGINKDFLDTLLRDDSPQGIKNSAAYYRIKNNLSGLTKEGYQVVLNPSLGTSYRDYTTFSMMPKAFRANSTHPLEVDVSTALQSFSLSFLQSNNLYSDYPETKEMIRDKTLYRATIAALSGEDIDTVKEAIVSLGYGGTFKTDYPDSGSIPQSLNIPKIKKLKREAIKIKNAVTENIRLIPDPDLHDYIALKTRHLKKRKDGKVGNPAKKIIYFSFLEYYEKKVRDALDPTGTAMAVHDAVYFSEYPIDIDHRIEKVEKMLNIKVTKSGVHK